MKILLILTLAALLTGCVSTTPAETIPDKPENPAELTQPDETALHIPDPIPADTPYTGEIFYFTRLPAKESTEPEPEDETVVIPPEPENTFRALAALAFDFANLPSNWRENNFTNTLISHTDEQPRIDSLEYLRMKTDGIVHPVDESRFTDPNGHTADGKPFSWEARQYSHPESMESGTEYLTYIRLNDTSMLCLSFYSYEYDADFVNDFLLPKLSSCRTWTPDIPLKIRFQSTPDADFHKSLYIDLSFPDTWMWNNSSVADDIEHIFTNQYTIKRMEFYPFIYEKTFCGFESLQSAGIPEPVTGITDKGLPYEIYAYNSMSEGEPLGITWYFANIEYDSRYIALFFVTFEDDPADYFDTVTLPVIKSVHIQPAE